ncbi:hypothetical protein [uncultured Psychromonas sp.]|uniref:hypothetical protein n=1 Tax=uncultured Psychromonas sp. TaxID=173974 RepID=UPI0026194461|nr:hypothetical protein [uncultured Psychromonas sp.]
MSQHLINDFINRTYVFKPFQTNKMSTGKVVKYQASNRNNNASPEDIEESVHFLKHITATKKTDQDEKPETKHIDITI